MNIQETIDHFSGLISRGLDPKTEVTIVDVEGTFNLLDVEDIDLVTGTAYDPESGKEVPESTVNVLCLNINVLEWEEEEDFEVNEDEIDVE